MRRVFVILLLPFLAGCAAGPSLQTRMISYMGAPEDRLIQSLGVPDKQITVNGVGYLAYVQQRSEVQPSPILVGFGGWDGGWGGAFGPYPYYGGFAGGLPAPVQVWSCETTFTVRDGHVANVSFKGNDCG
jgi:hypothetical protein